MGRIYVDKYTARLERSDLYRVRLILRDGSIIDDLEPKRLFPFSNTSMYISLLNKNEKEIALVRDLNEIDEESRKVLDECFREYYMIPKITHVYSCEDRNILLVWDVETDRGRISFRIRSCLSDIKSLGNGRVIIRDSNDNRYEITNYDELDSHSKRLIFSYL